MKYKGYILNFTTAIHVGDGKLESSDCDIHADTLFSALCHEALAQEGVDSLNKLVEKVKNGLLKFSDAFPVYEDKHTGETTFYIPKPIINVEKPQAEISSGQKKQIKKMKYIPFEHLSSFALGKFPCPNSDEKPADVGISEIRTMSKISEGEHTKPYSVGVFTFKEGWALYLIIGYNADDDLMSVKELLTGLGYAGIGGKRSSGLGKFTLKHAKIPTKFTDTLVVGENIGKFMSLSVGLPIDEELETVTENAEYLLLQRRGFISSETFAETNRKKKDFYCFNAGSTFKKTFEGRLEDVAIGGNHPVYRYAKPIFMEVR